MKLVLAAIAILSGLAFTGCSRTSGVVKAESTRKMAPDFALKDAAGKTVRLSDYRGDVVLLNFWATWCGPCQIEIPWFIDFQKNYKDRKFAVLGVSMDDDGWKSVKPYIEQRKINYPIVVGTEETSQLYGGIDSLPTTFIIDRGGRIAAVHTGLVSKSVYQDEINKLLDDKDDGGVLQEPARRSALVDPRLAAVLFAR
ncbi:MAG TPA: TlpA disulfide reductase family protein [Bryobacteraceae bacterium]|jgi:peroxiredoxin|nr:TlpA disulfide reductase family protein [Bryobacteraceae bacterium]